MIPWSTTSGGSSILPDLDERLREAGYLTLAEHEKVDSQQAINHDRMMGVVRTIDGFEDACAEGEYTDTGDVADLLSWIRDTLWEVMDPKPRKGLRERYEAEKAVAS